MHERAVQLKQSAITWVLVADGTHAQIYDCRKILRKIPLGGANKHHYSDEKSGYELLQVSDGMVGAESIDNYQTGHDRRGTTSSSNSSAHNTYEPRGDIQEELTRRFMSLIATKLRQACEKKAFDHLILVAPAKIIGELRNQLGAEVQNRIAAVLAKDLAHYPKQMLVTHLGETLAEAHIT